MVTRFCNGHSSRGSEYVGDADGEAAVDRRERLRLGAARLVAADVEVELRAGVERERAADEVRDRQADPGGERDLAGLLYRRRAGRDLAVAEHRTEREPGAEERALAEPQVGAALDRAAEPERGVVVALAIVGEDPDDADRDVVHEEPADGQVEVGRDPGRRGVALGLVAEDRERAEIDRPHPFVDAGDAAALVAVQIVGGGGARGGEEGEGEREREEYGGTVHRPLVAAGRTLSHAGPHFFFSSATRAGSWSPITAIARAYNAPACLRSRRRSASSADPSSE